MEENRDNTLFYTVSVILGVAMLWLASTLFLSLIATPRLESAKQSIVNIGRESASLLTIRSKQGELVYKTDLLAPILDYKIDTQLIFSVVDSLTADAGQVTVSAYERESSGKFVFRMITQDYETISNVMENAYTELEDQISQPILRSVRYDQENSLFVSTLALEINGISPADQN